MNMENAKRKLKYTRIVIWCGILEILLTLFRLAIQGTRQLGDLTFGFLAGALTLCVGIHSQRYWRARNVESKDDARK
jgi:hypothetical protein